jgi:hypothetical protein
MVDHQALLPNVMDIMDMTVAIIGFFLSFRGDRDGTKDKIGA